MTSSSSDSDRQVVRRKESKTRHKHTMSGGENTHRRHSKSVSKRRQSKSSVRHQSKKTSVKRRKRHVTPPTSSSESESEADSDSSGFVYHISFESSSEEDEAPPARRRPEIGKGVGNKGKGKGRCPSHHRQRDFSRRRTASSPEHFDSDDQWEGLGVAKQKSLAELTKVTPAQLQAKSQDTNDGGPVDVAALERALALAHAVYDQNEVKGPKINDGYARIVNDALR